MNLEIVAVTYAGEKITIKHTTISQALGALVAGGVPEDWIYSFGAHEESKK